LHIGMSIACSGPVNNDWRPSAADAIVGESAGTVPSWNGQAWRSRRRHPEIGARIPDPTVSIGLSGREMMHTAETPRQKLVIGNGMAAGRVLDELFARASDRYDVTMFGAEPRVNYDRIMLSPVLAGEKQFDDIIVHHEDW
jgi:hypothetical protein